MSTLQRRLVEQFHVSPEEADRLVSAAEAKALIRSALVNRTAGIKVVAQDQDLNDPEVWRDEIRKRMQALEILQEGVGGLEQCSKLLRRIIQAEQKLIAGKTTTVNHRGQDWWNFNESGWALGGREMFAQVIADIFNNLDEPKIAGIIVEKIGFKRSIPIPEDGVAPLAPVQEVPAHVAVEQQLVKGASLPSHNATTRFMADLAKLDWEQGPGGHSWVELPAQEAAKLLRRHGWDNQLPTDGNEKDVAPGITVYNKGDGKIHILVMAALIHNLDIHRAREMAGFLLNPHEWVQNKLDPKDLIEVFNDMDMSPGTAGQIIKMRTQFKDVKSLANAILEKFSDDPWRITSATEWKEDRWGRGLKMWHWTQKPYQLFVQEIEGPGTSLYRVHVVGPQGTFKMRHELKDPKEAQKAAMNWYEMETEGKFMPDFAKMWTKTTGSVKAGSDYLIPYVVKVTKTFGNKHFTTPMAFDSKDVGGKTDKHLAKWVEHFNESLEPGGVNQHLGSDSMILEAVLIDQRAKKQIAHYKMANPPKFVAWSAETHGAAIPPHMWVISKDSTGAYIVTIGDPRQPGSKIKARFSGATRRDDLKDWVRDNVGTAVSPTHMMDMSGLNLVKSEVKAAEFPTNQQVNRAKKIAHDPASNAVYMDVEGTTWMYPHGGHPVNQGSTDKFLRNLKAGKYAARIRRVE